MLPQSNSGLPFPFDGFPFLFPSPGDPIQQQGSGDHNRTIGSCDYYYCD
jgi:hypothetical protein